MADLMRLTGLNPREIKRRVQQERRRHFICSRKDGRGGYYRPATFDDINDFIRSQERLIKHHAASLRLARRLKQRKGDNA